MMLALDGASGFATTSNPRPRTCPEINRASALKRLFWQASS